MFFSGSNKQNTQHKNQSVVTGPQDVHKTFNAADIRKSLEVLKECITNRENQATNNLLTTSFITAFAQKCDQQSRLNECKAYLCDALQDTKLQKHYLLLAATKQYLALDIAIGLLFSNKQAINSWDIAAILNIIDHTTGQYASELNRTLQLRKQNLSPQAAEIIRAAEESEEAQSKEALLRILPLDQLERKEISIYNLIMQLPKEDQKSLMEKFFFNKSSSINFNSLAKAINTESRVNLPNLFQFMESIYSPADLKQKALQLEISYDGYTICESIFWIPAWEERIQYLVEKSPIHNFIPYTLFSKDRGVVAQKILSEEEATTFLRRLNERHPKNIYIEDAIKRIQENYKITF